MSLHINTNKQTKLSYPAKIMGTTDIGLLQKT